MISRWKNDFVTPDQSLHQATHEGDLAAAKVYRVYQDTLFAYQAMDFDDLIRLPVELFEKHAAVLENGRTSCATCCWTNTRTPTPASINW